MPLGKREAEFWTKLRKGLLSADPTILLDRIESPGTGRGIPDVHMTDPKYGDCWIELKVARGNKVALSSLQIVWLSQRAKAGSRCRIVVFDPAFKIVFVYDGEHAQLVAERGLATPARKVYPGENWSRVREHLYYDITGTTCT